ncbi:hypothetical protein C4J93_3395 [Pseudomonas sp. R2-37-08W]|nr:hypothetical protein C4J93_3395 [Pseudomonas sp. R2-37-08W]
MQRLRKLKTHRALQLPIDSIVSDKCRHTLHWVELSSRAVMIEQQLSC